MRFWWLATVVPGPAAAVPTTLEHQGRLLDATGAPVSRDRLLGFDLYSSASSTTSLWA
jgi:hypothetical protein